MSLVPHIEGHAVTHNRMELQMTAIYETAYPRIKPDITINELENLYTPSAAELKFVTKQRRQPHAQYILLLLLKTFQRLGYFILLKEVPYSVKKHITKSIPNYSFNEKKLNEYDKSGARQRFLNILRKYIKVNAFDKKARDLIDQITEQAAQTKQELPDIINIAIEELVRKHYELPGFSSLVRSAKKSRSRVNNNYFKLISDSLTPTLHIEINDLLSATDIGPFTGWNELKREPKKPTNKEIRSYLDHIQWLQSWTQKLPDINMIPVSKRRQFMYEARALDAADLKKMKSNKRYALVVILLYSQLYKATDNVMNILIRKINNMHTQSEERLKKYHVDQVKRVEKLISQFRDVLNAFQSEKNDQQRIKDISQSFRSEPEQLLAECEEHMSYAGNNYYPFMLSPYQSLRPLLLNCLKLVDLQSTTKDQSIIKAIKFILANRSSHKECLELLDINGKCNELKLHWIPEKWRKLVTGQSKVNAKITSVHRRYFELCVLTQVARELRSADLIVADSEEYNDFNTQLIKWEQYEEQMPAYCEMLGLPTTTSNIVEKLKQDLVNTASKLDQSYPDNEWLTITSQGLTLHRHDKSSKPDNLEKIDGLIKQRLETKNILDILIESEGWLNLHKKFSPISGFEGKIIDPRKRFITSLFCYGCNLGPSQTAQSIKGLSRKQVAWLNLHHVTEERLDKAIVDVINSYNKFRLPNYWGTGKHASADGTKWNLYEQNLLSEYHIRYGGYGGIGYYHVSDKYIALFSHFIPCGVYEAVYILDGMIKNESDIQPDTIHGDTQAQSAPVFGLAYLLGIDLMPRIRNIKDLIFFKPEKGIKYKHINRLFKESINWQLIETHMPDMLRIALSIKAGRLTPSAILRRLGTYSRKNRVYFAFRELGRVIRTIFLLKYIGDIELRKTVHSATNKSEEFNNFTKWLFFGGEGVIAENVRHEQNKIIKYNQLVANLVILYNVESMTSVLKALQKDGTTLNEKILGGLSPYRTSHINRFGDYTLDLRSSNYQPDYKTDFF